MVRLIAVLSALGLTGALLSGCLLPRGESGPTYVAMGDSYTAAPYIGRLDKRDTCFRSRNNYPHLVADEADLDLTDASCAAATTEAVEGEQRTPQGRVRPPQIEDVDRDTDVVTLGIGANDFNLIGRIIIDCVKVARTVPTGQPCTDLDARAGDDAVDTRLVEMEQRLVAVIEAVRAKAPDAQVLVIGYPQMFPAAGGCPDLPVPAADVAFARRLNVGVNAALSSAATTTGADFVDVFAETEGHDICGDDPWIAGAVAREKGLAYHPYAEEQELVARLVVEALD